MYDANRTNINRRNFLKAIGMGAIAAGVTGCDIDPGKTAGGGKTTLTGSRPNIILIMADDASAQDFSCYGGTNPLQTPNVDKLAKTGVQFRTAYATPLCGPSRALLLSGKYATRTGHWCNWGAFNTGSVNSVEGQTFYRLLHDAGYKTAVTGKWSWDRPNTPAHCDEACIWPREVEQLTDEMKAQYKGPVGTDPLWHATSRYWQPCVLKNGELMPTTPDDYGPDIYTDFVIDFAKRSSESGKPFMVYYPMVLPHGADELRPGKIFPPTPDPDNKGEKIDGGVKGMKAYVDHIVGRIVKGLDENGLRENTIVIFTTDNGGYGNRGKSTVCEPGVWVPFIVNCPEKIAARGMVDEMASLADILPTFAEFAGATLTEEVDGMSFVPVLEGKPGKRDHLFTYLGSEVTLRDRRWMLERYFDKDNPGKFWDCGDITAGGPDDEPNKFYKDVTDSKKPEVVAAKEKFMKLLAQYPVPQGIPRTWAERREAELKMRAEKELNK